MTQFEDALVPSASFELAGRLERWDAASKSFIRRAGARACCRRGIATKASGSIESGEAPELKDGQVGTADLPTKPRKLRDWSNLRRYAENSLT
jgi:hypothetical protein